MLKSITSRIVILFLFLVFVPLLFVGTYLAVSRYNSLLEELVVSHRNEAEHMAQDVATSLHVLQQKLELVANMLSIQGGDDAQRVILMRGFHTFQPFLDELAFIDSTGGGMAINKGGEILRVGREQQNKLLLKRTKRIKHSFSTILHHHNNSLAILKTVSPVFFLNKHLVNGVLTLDSSLVGVTDRVQHYSQLSGVEAAVFLVDGDQVNKENPFALSATEISGLLTGLKEARGLIVNNSVIGVCPVPFAGVDIYVGMCSDLQKKMAPFRRSFQFVIVFLLLAFAVSLLIGLFFVKRLLLGPLSELSAVARQIGDGDFSRQVELNKGSEFYELADAFNSMTEELAKSLHALRAESVQRENAEKKSRELMVVAQGANKAKSLFIANISHEIRTSINGIMGVTSLMLESDLNAEQQQRMELVNRSTRRLLNIINGILDYSTIEAGGGLKPVRFSIEQLVSDAIELITHEAENKTIAVSYTIDKHIPFELLADAGKIYQIVLNLLINSLKNTSEGTISVDVRLLADTDSKRSETIQVCVTDTGGGVDESVRENIFSPFAQGEVGQFAGCEGTGLGLSICAKLASLLEGEIWFEDNSSKGCRFYFTCKCERVPETEKKYNVRRTEGASEQLSLAGITVYVAEDEFINQYMLTSYLQEYGAKTVSCDNGQLLLDAMEGEQPDIILMDIGMPVMGGLEATERIRAAEKETGKRVAIIALTAHETVGFAQKCFEVGMDAYFTKPLEFGQLLQAIIEWSAKK
jgi:signal transduction histidine kinase/ActR/RegA family two-component response regulator